ncbi:MAG: SirB2 family protein [Rhodoferax sp.]|jgi:uncharacterized membrane protein SirB2
MDYYSIKTLHQSAVGLSLLGFFARGAASLSGAAWVRSRAAKTIPHIVDTVLLLSAITLAWLLRLNPLVTPWLMAKIVGLLVYIGLGVLALRPGLPLRVRLSAWVLALVSFAYIASVAITKSPVGFFGFMIPS